jgi:hypothetical protein
MASHIRSRIVGFRQTRSRRWHMGAQGSECLAPFLPLARSSLALQPGLGGTPIHPIKKKTLTALWWCRVNDCPLSRYLPSGAIERTFSVLCQYSHVLYGTSREATPPRPSLNLQMLLLRTQEGRFSAASFNCSVTLDVLGDLSIAPSSDRHPGSGGDEFGSNGAPQATAHSTAFTNNATGS